MPIDPNAQAAHELAVKTVGQSVTFGRQSGLAPHVTVTSATVTAIVRDFVVDTTTTAASGYAASQVGSITEGDRQLIVMAQDLAAAGFPLPLQKGDTATIAATGEVLTIVRVDAAKRFMAGCIEAFGSGVQ